MPGSLEMCRGTAFSLSIPSFFRNYLPEAQTLPLLVTYRLKLLPHEISTIFSWFVSSLNILSSLNDDDEELLGSSKSLGSPT